MSLAGWNNNKKLTLTIDSTKVDENIINFPVLITLSSGTGITSFDASAVFTELTPASGTLASGTVLLLHCDGTNGSTSFIDESTSNHTITANDNAQISTAQSMFGGSSAYFDGTGDYLSIADSADWDFAGGPFTIDFRVMKDVSHTGIGHVISRWDSVNNDERWSIRYNDNDLQVFLGAWQTITLGVDNNWHHVVWIYDSGLNTVYFDGIEELSYSFTLNDHTSQLRVGGLSASELAGYIDELRISKGIARWTSDFIPPTGPYGSSWDNRKKIAVTATVSGVETELPVEIDYWDSENNQSWLWTKVPTIVSGTDTTLYLYYDSTHTINSGYIGDTGETPAQSVWDSNFVGVWHMGQSPAGDVSDIMRDSTSNSNDGTPGGSMTSADLIDGQIGKAIDFDGSDDLIDCGTDASLDITGALTISAIVKPLTNPAFAGIIDMAQESTSIENYSMLNFAGTLYFQYNNSGWQSHIESSFFDTGVQQSVDITYNAGTIQFYKDGSPTTSVGGKPVLVSDTSNTFKIGRYQVGSQGNFDGIIDEVRISDSVRSTAWTKATYYSNFGDLITYALGIEPTIFTFSGPIPIHLSTVYGTNHTLQLTTTITGADIPYVYAATFYDDGNNQIGSTVYGLDSGAQATSTAALSTPAATTYSWYIKSTSSGSTGTSQTYTFTNRFLCEGYTEVNGTRASGIPVRLYRRSTGVLVSGTESTGVSGTFSIVTSYNEAHYAVALHPTDSGTNALIYDYLTPE